MNCLVTALSWLVETQQVEGEVLRDLLLGYVASIEVLTRRAGADPSRESAQVHQRLAERIQLLLKISPALCEAQLNMGNIPPDQG